MTRQLQSPILIGRPCGERTRQTPSTGLRHPFSTEECAGKQALVSDILSPRRSVPESKHWFTTSFLHGGMCRKASTGFRHLFSTECSGKQALVSDILSPRRKEPESKHWFPTSFLHGGGSRKASTGFRHPFSTEEGAGKRRLATGAWGRGLHPAPPPHTHTLPRPSQSCVRSGLYTKKSPQINRYKHPLLLLLFYIKIDSGYASAFRRVWQDVAIQ